MRTGGRLILCRNCSGWKQSPNVELGACNMEESNIIPTFYDSRCIFGLYENVETPPMSDYIVSADVKEL